VAKTDCRGVANPSTRSIDLGEKVRDYGWAGIPEYWVVDGEREEVVVYRREAATVTAGRLESSAVPGFWLDAGWLFQRPLPPVAECLRQLMT
jgi:Uma2 family endonuclease